MKEYKQNMKKRVIIAFSLVLLMIFAYGIGLQTVKGDWITTATLTDVEATFTTSDADGISSNNNLIFYDSLYDRWYILWTDDLGGTNDFIAKYAFSDTGDITSWNSGGNVPTNYLTTNSPKTLATSRVAWCFDNVNRIGHFCCADYDTGVQYMNFTIEVGGGLTFGSLRTVWSDSATLYGGVDMCTGHDYKPMFVYGGYIDSTFQTVGFGCDSIDGYNGQWTKVYFRPVFGRNYPSIIPTGNRTCIIIASDAFTETPLRYYEIDFDSTSNSTGTGTLFTDGSLYRWDLLNDCDLLSYGVGYNSTHGVVSYCPTDGDLWAFVFDFDTMTKSDEYCVDDSGNSGAGWKCWFSGAVFETNEPFVGYMYWFSATTARDIRGNEYFQTGYEGYFNTSAHQDILTDYSSVYSNYHGSGGNQARMTDANGLNLYMVVDNTYVAVTSWTVEGQYPTPEPPEETESFSVDNSLIFIIVGAISFIIIMALMTMAKGKVKM